jgi:hypothetical protein
MAKITLTIQDNPMVGLPGQPDVVITVNSDGPLPIPISPATAEKLTPAQLGAIVALSTLERKSYETSWLRINQDSPQ